MTNSIAEAARRGQELIETLSDRIRQDHFWIYDLCERSRNLTAERRLATQKQLDNGST